MDCVLPTQDDMNVVLPISVLKQVYFGFSNNSIAANLLSS